MSSARYTDPADDPVPDDLTEEEKAAVRRQGERIAAQRAAGVPLLGDRRRGIDYDFGD
ncbi:hypothetical protein [Nocardiopsis sp. CC223A]|uniref:hypothetical protein n=1 Tax=Nocardiopsis sp. CC223A TaxID=3044051 RepID=UPI00278C1DFB|nr:hypothetical protein [Nocardiopsis sp. CC223A]